MNSDRLTNITPDGALIQLDIVRSKYNCTVTLVKSVRAEAHNQGIPHHMLQLDVPNWNIQIKMNVKQYMHAEKVRFYAYNTFDLRNKYTLISAYYNYNLYCV